MRIHGGHHCCYLPFLFNGELQTSCLKTPRPIGDFRPRESWCSMHYDFDRNKKWKYCIGRYFACVSRNCCTYGPGELVFFHARYIVLSLGFYLLYLLKVAQGWLRHSFLWRYHSMTWQRKKVIDTPFVTFLRQVTCKLLNGRMPKMRICQPL